MGSGGQPMKLILIKRKSKRIYMCLESLGPIEKQAEDQA